MYYLIIDTCEWINLLKKFPEISEKIIELIDNGEVSLILPKIIVDEWNRHKSKLIKEEEHSIRGLIKNVRSLTKYLDSEAAKTLQDILLKFQEQSDQIEEIALRAAQRIDDLFQYPSTILLDVTETAKLKAVDFALAKKAPFREKNSMADALIVFVTLEYIEKEGLNNCIFISSNTRDFSSPTKNDIVHEDLRELFEKGKLKYFINIALAIKLIDDSITEESIQIVADVVNQPTQSIHYLSEEMMESLRFATEGFTMAEFLEKNLEILEGVKETSKAVNMMNMFGSFQEVNQEILESLRLATESFTMTDFLEKNLAILEGVKVTSEGVNMMNMLGPFQEVNQELLENLKAATGAFSIQLMESFQGYNQHLVGTINLPHNLLISQDTLIRKNDPSEE